MKGYNIDINDYKEFVDQVTSNDSKDFESFLRRCKELHSHGFNIPRLLTGAIGGSGEVGEYNEIVKKLLFHGKPLTDEVKEHLKKEMGDKFWYLMQDCLALDLDPNEIMEANMQKLKSRYPGGKFDAYFSENRQEGDI